MTLLFMDGFDHYATADITKKWNSSSSVSINSAYGRRGGGAIYTSGASGYVSKTLPSSYSTLVFGAAFYDTHTGTSIWDIIQFKESTVVHVTLAIDSSSRKLKIYRGTTSGTLLATSNTSISASTWYYVEIKLTINDTTGATEVRINGVADSGLTLTSTDTRNAGTSGVIDNVYLTGGTSSAGASRFDDLYVCSTAGSTNNDFLGDCRVDTLFPSGDGNYTAFTPSTGTTHYTLVKETAPNTTDYNSGSASGNRDSYAFDDLTSLSSQTIYGVQINAAALKSDAGARSLGTMSRLSGTDKDGTGAALGTGQSYISEIQETDPASAAWTQTNVNSAEFGVKVTA